MTRDNMQSASSVESSTERSVQQDVEGVLYLYLKSSFDVAFNGLGYVAWVLSIVFFGVAASFFMLAFAGFENMADVNAINTGMVGMATGLLLSSLGMMWMLREYRLWMVEVGAIIFIHVGFMVEFFDMASK